MNIEITGTTDPAERALMIREVSRMQRWRMASYAAVIVAALFAIPLTCSVVCATQSSEGM